MITRGFGGAADSVGNIRDCVNFFGMRDGCGRRGGVGGEGVEDMSDKASHR
jgi:hypothetical protein